MLSNEFSMYFGYLYLKSDPLIFENKILSQRIFFPENFRLEFRLNYSKYVLD